MTRLSLTPRLLVEGLRQKLKKSLGQNFLIDESITRAIAREVDTFDPGYLLEIGPGAGALTVALSALHRPILAIEKDDRCAAYLHDVFAESPEVTIQNGDALSCELPAFCLDPAARPLLVSNLPYNVASPIYFRFLHLPLVGMVLMFQREVADRFLAPPSSPNYGALSVIGQYFHFIERVIDVPPQAFLPRPKIWSTVLRFTPAPPKLAPHLEARFSGLVRAAFAMRRKTLVNNLKNYAGRSKDQWTQVLQSQAIDPNARAEDLSIAQFVRLTESLTTPP